TCVAKRRYTAMPKSVDPARPAQAGLGAIFRPVAKGGRLGESRLTAKADDTTKFPCRVKGILGGAGPTYALRRALCVVWCSGFGVFAGSNFNFRFSPSLVGVVCRLDAGQRSLLRR